MFLRQKKKTSEALNKIQRHAACVAPRAPSSYKLSFRTTLLQQHLNLLMTKTAMTKNCHTLVSASKLQEVTTEVLTGKEEEQGDGETTDDNDMK